MNFSAGQPVYGDTNLSIAALLEKQKKKKEKEGKKPPESRGVGPGWVVAVEQGSSSRS